MQRSDLRDNFLLISRFGLAISFVMMGWNEIGYGSSYEVFTIFPDSSPGMFFTAPALLIGLFGSLMIAFGLCSSSVSFLMAVYATASAFLGHNYWNSSIEAQHDMCVHFFEYISMAFGFMILIITGPGALSLDGFMNRQKQIIS